MDPAPTTEIEQLVVTDEPPPSPVPSLPPAVAPVAEERLTSVDTVRGMAVLGILLMNILSFGLPDAASNNPHIAGGDDAPNVLFWFVSHVLFEGKMRCTFSMLFGAGVILLTSRAERRGAGLELADVYYRRTLWLIAFGMIHAYFLWAGDILYAYGVVGLMLFPLRKARPVWLIVAGSVLLALHMLMGMGMVWAVADMKAEAAEATAVLDAGKRPTDEQIDAIAAWNGLRGFFDPSPEQVEETIASHRGNYFTSFAERAGAVVAIQSRWFYKFIFFDVASMMLLGMAFMKLGVFSGERDTRFYLRLMLIGYGIGVPLNIASGINILWSDFDMQQMGAWTQATYGPGRLAVALGHIGLLVWLVKTGRLTWLTNALAQVGRMPLTNYLLTTVLCCLIFEGYGLGMFARLQRYQLLGVVFLVWAILILLSKVWLRYYRFGPMEWVWRSLAYWKRPVMRRQPA